MSFADKKHPQCDVKNIWGEVGLEMQESLELKVERKVQEVLPVPSLSYPQCVRFLVVSEMSTSCPLHVCVL